MSYSEGDASSSQATDMSITGIRGRQKQELEDLTLLTQPLKTLKFFVLGVGRHIRTSVSYLRAHSGWLLPFSIVIAGAGIFLFSIEGPQKKHFEEIQKYFEYGLWWLILGVASSIGLGSGLHTFVLYLGPHIALFTVKAVQCGRVDLKFAPYDTIQLKRGPSWLDKDCSEFGPPLFTSLRVPLSSILPKVQAEAILWGIGTAIGELPPYFVSRAARISGRKLEDSSTESNGLISARVNKIKGWFREHSQHLNFFTILVLASVPNPLFDLAGIMCGQFGVPFWKFFLSTLIGKAIIKTHIQTIFIISVCNNQLLDWMENELIWVFSFVPGLASVLPNVIAKLNSVKDKYMKGQSPVTPNTKVKKWDFSFASIWSTVVWLMLMNFSIEIVNSTARGHMKKQQEEELKLLSKNLLASTNIDSSDHASSE